MRSLQFDLFNKERMIFKEKPIHQILSAEREVLCLQSFEVIDKCKDIFEDCFSSDQIGLALLLQLQLSKYK